MKKNRIIFALISALLILALAACGNAASLQTADSDMPSCVIPEDVPPNLDEAESGITVTDQAGRTVEINAPVERIVSGYYIPSSACIALGLADKLVGIEAKAESRPIYSLAAPALLELPNVGTAKEFNLEACAALKPDLVILPLRLKEAAETLTELGIPVILVNPESYGELTEMLELIGKAAGAELEAAKLLAYYDAALADINALTAPLTERPRTYMCGVSSYLSTSPKGMYQSALIELAGGVNAADIEGDSRVEVSYEQLIAMNPEVIIIPSEAGYGALDIINDEQLKSVDAVQNNRVYKMPDAFEAWDSPVPSCMVGARWLLATLHENAYSANALRGDAASFYKDFYGIEIDSGLIGR